MKASSPVSSRFRDVLDLVPDAVIRLDRDTLVVGMNEAACRLTGYEVSDLVGRSCGEALRVRDREGKPLLARAWHPSAYLRSVRGSPEQIAVVRRRDGSEVVASVTAAYQRDEDGRLQGAILCVRDAARRSHQAVSAMEIVSTVSHELRSPLTSVKGYTSLLLNRWDKLRDDQKQMMLQQVNHDADRVTRLITELLDISRLETGRLVLRRQMVDLARLATTVVDKVRLEYPKLQAETEFDDGFPKVYADADKIEQVLTNLVENACKYASPEGLRIRGTAFDGFVSVAVHDRGEGIPPADLPKVFHKFYRRSVGKPTGSGLGLWISRGLVESHGGRLEAESTLGDGSIFRFTLPVGDLDSVGAL
jgi:PAS domain S-box-containing protein